MKLTVLLVTYEHAPFITAAIESVLMQETDFEFEIIISEDHSTDGTREIIQCYADAYPDRIRLLLSDRNLNDNFVVRRGLEAARGQYVALLDGDDFWTSKHKLQQQVVLLDKSPECSVCCHNVNVVYEDEEIEGHPFHQEKPTQRLADSKPKAISTLVDIVRGNFMPTCSVVFRSGPARRLPEGYDQEPFGDWSLHLWNARHGHIAYIDEVMATYRVHPGGFWSANMSLYRRMEDVATVVDYYGAIDRQLDFAFSAEVRQGIAYVYESAAYSMYRAGLHRWAAICAGRALRLTPMRPRGSLGLIRLVGFASLGHLTTKRRQRIGGDR